MKSNKPVNEDAGDSQTHSMGGIGSEQMPGTQNINDMLRQQQNKEITTAQRQPGYPLNNFSNTTTDAVINIDNLIFSLKIAKVNPSIKDTDKIDAPLKALEEMKRKLWKIGGYVAKIK
jgi:hypothetical protein